VAARAAIGVSLPDGSAGIGVDAAPAGADAAGAGEAAGTTATLDLGDGFRARVRAAGLAVRAEGGFGAAGLAAAGRALGRGALDGLGAEVARGAVARVAAAAGARLIGAGATAGLGFAATDLAATTLFCGAATAAAAFDGARCATAMRLGFAVRPSMLAITSRTNSQILSAS
jgi:hypothetical protein